MAPVALLRVGADGRIVGGNAQARRFWGPLAGRDCHRTVCGHALSGERICREDCVPQHTSASSPGESQARLALVRGQRCTLQCERVGDEVVVMVRPSQPLGAPGETLTPRERQTLALVGEGLTRNEIAARLGLRPATVRTHLERARARLGARSLAHAVTLWLSRRQ